MPGPVATTPSPTLTDKLTAGAALVGTNVPVIAAPLMSHLDPSMNPDGAGGPVVAIIAGFINAVIQAFKMHDWYEQNKWAAWTVIVLGFVICLAIWHDQLRLGFLNAFATITNALTNYKPMNTVGMLGAGSDKPTAPVEVTT